MLEKYGKHALFPKSIVVFTRMATVSKDGTWKIWDIDGEFAGGRGGGGKQ